MRAQTDDRHETDLARRGGLGNVIDADARGEAALVLELVGRRAAEISLIVLEFLHRPHTRSVDGQQKVVMRLQVDGARAARAGDEIDDPGVPRVPHVEDGDAIAETVPDVGKAAMHHDLDAVATPPKVRMADELDVA